MWRNPYFSELLLPFQNDIIYSPLDVMLAFNVHCYKQFAMEIIHIVHIWGKAFEYPHVHVMLKWDVLGDSASERCHSSWSCLCILLSCDAIITCPLHTYSRFIPKCCQSETQWISLQASVCKRDIIKNPGWAQGHWRTPTLWLWLRSGHFASWLEPLDVRHSLTASAGK